MLCTKQRPGTWWVYDQNPLGARLPTRLWYDGLADSETWQAPLTGRPRARTLPCISPGLYRTRDLDRIPARDGDGDLFRDARVPLGTLTID